MAKEPGKPEDMSDPVILRLVEETGITEAEAREIVGSFWASSIGRHLSGKPGC